MVERPNRRLQRTRVARCARPGSPLTRHPLGGTKAVVARPTPRGEGCIVESSCEPAVITLGVAYA